MKKVLTVVVVFAVAAMCGTVQAEENGKEDIKELSELNKKIKAMLEVAPKGPHGGKLVSPELKALMDQRSGGLVYPKTNGKTLLIVDARGVQDGIVESFAKDAKGRFHIGITTVSRDIADNDDPFEFANGCKTAMNPAVLMLVDRPGKPVLSIYPEEAVGIVNVASLKTADKELFETRVAKETWRGIALALGGFATVAPNGRVVKSILAPVYSTKDLDDMKVQSLSPNQCAAVYESISKVGIQAARPVVYSVAVRQGWAPAPTNEIQKAIWDKVHALPTEPIKIAPETQKVTK